MKKCPNCGYADALTVNEAADLLGVSGQTIRNWIEAGKLKADRQPRARDSSGFVWVIAAAALRTPSVKKMTKAAHDAARLAREGRAAAVV